MDVASSPLSSPPASDPTASDQYGLSSKHIYRPVRQLPYELAQHVQIYFGEHLFTQALSLLTSLLSSGASSLESAMPTYVPGPTHIALCATLAVHPNLTSRTTSREKWGQAISALGLIRLTNTVVGPVNADFAAALGFTRYLNSARYNRNSEGRASHSLITNAGEQDDLTSAQSINSAYANEESIWQRAEDFWHVVGWTLNCACLSKDSNPDDTYERDEPGNMYAARWKQWSVWLDTVLSILEADLALRFSSSASTATAPPLILQYLTSTSTSSHAQLRRITRSIFADGTSKSLNEFPQIFNRELKPPKDPTAPRPSKAKKQEVPVDLDHYIYGDYYMQGGDDGSASDPDDGMGTADLDRSTRVGNLSRRRITPRTSTSNLRAKAVNGNSDTRTPSPDGLGPPEAITLRLRLLSLLSALCSYHPTPSSSKKQIKPTPALSTDDLQPLLVEFIRVLPLPTFRSFLFPTIRAPRLLTDRPQQTLSLPQLLPSILLPRLLESAAPATNPNFTPQRHDSGVIGLAALTTGSLPFRSASATTVDDAKVSLCLEAMLREALVAGKGAKESMQLGMMDVREAVAKGVERRVNRNDEGARSGVRGRKRRGNGGGAIGEEEEEEAWQWLVDSGERMAGLVKDV